MGVFVVNGTALESPAWSLWTTDGLYQTPPLRGSDIVTPGQHGELDPERFYLNPRRRFGPGAVAFNLQAFGLDSTGVVPDDDLAGEQAVLDRIGDLINLFVGRQLYLQHLRADGDRVCIARLAESIAPVIEPGSPYYGRIRATCTIPTSFWRSVTASTATVTGPSGSNFSLAPFAGNAPCSDAEVRFGPSVNPFLAHGEHYVGYLGTVPAGSELLIQGGVNRVVAGAGAPWTPNPGLVSFNLGPSMVEIDPTAQFSVPVASFTHTGGGSATCSLSGYRKWMTA